MKRDGSSTQLPRTNWTARLGKSSPSPAGAPPASPSLWKVWCRPTRPWLHCSNYPDAYEELHGAGLEEAFGLESALGASNALRKFLVEMFQYRHVSAVNYFDTYSSDQLAVDLLTPAWWITIGGCPKDAVRSPRCRNRSP